MEARARFTRMRDGTAEQFALIHAGETEYEWLPLEHFAAAVEDVFSRAPSFR
jgi:hypothetical protein